MASVNDIISLIVEIGKLVHAAKWNETRLVFLKKRLERIGKVLQKGASSKKEKMVNYKALKEVLKEALNFVRDCCGHGWLKKLLYGRTTAAKLDEIQLRLDGCIQDLQLEIAFDKSEDKNMKIASIKDVQELISFLNQSDDSEIKSLSQSELKKLKDALFEEESKSKATVGSFDKIEDYYFDIEDSCLDPSPSDAKAVDEEKIGEGGMGVVYKSQYLNETVAVKVIPLNNITAEGRKKFESEIRILLRLNHPNIVRVFGANLSNRPFMVMDYYPHNLCHILHSNKPELLSRLDWLKRWQIAYEVAKGMRFLHSQRKPIVHGDLKSPNVLLSADLASVVIADFGLAYTKIEFTTTKTKLLLQSKDEKGGFVGGTERWMAPEQFEIGQSHRSSDVYSFGMLMYEIATNKYPFEDRDPRTLAFAIVKGERPDIDSEKDVPKKFSKLMKDCWNKKINKRPKFEEIVKILEAEMLKEMERNRKSLSSGNSMEYQEIDTNYDICGYLEKKSYGTFFGDKWKKRFFMLKGLNLSWSIERNTEIKGNIRLDELGVTFTSVEKLKCLHFKTPNKTYEWRFPDELSLKRCVDALRKNGAFESISSEFSEIDSISNDKSKSEEKKQKSFEKASDQGDADATFKLALCYENGKGVPKNVVKAVQLYEKASDQGHAGATFNLAVCYENGKGVPKNVVKAVQLYEKASDQGDAAATNNLALCYENGEGVPKNVVKAVQLYEKASDQGHAATTLSLADCYYNGEGVPKNVVKAVQLYEKASDQGDAGATFKLAYCYEDGLGVPKNVVKAVQLYEKASDQGDADATYNLALCYENGEGVPKNVVKAVQLFEKASDQGDAGATYNLALCYENGKGVPKNVVKAVQLYEKASDQGDAGATYNLALCYENGKGVPKNVVKAVQLYEKASDQGHADATFNLAVCYENGKGVPKNVVKAVQLYEKASDQDENEFENDENDDDYEEEVENEDEEKIGGKEEEISVSLDDYDDEEEDDEIDVTF